MGLVIKGNRTEIKSCLACGNIARPCFSWCFRAELKWVSSSAKRLECCETEPTWSGLEMTCVVARR